MPSCKVSTCKNHTGQRLTKNSSVKPRFFGFPKDRKLAEKWLYLCRRDNLKVSIPKYEFIPAHDRMCSIHFAPDAFEMDMKTKMLWESGNLDKPPPLKLKPDAVPTLHLPLHEDETIGSTRSLSEARISARDKEENREREFRDIEEDIQRKKAEEMEAIQEEPIDISHLEENDETLHAAPQTPAEIQESSRASHTQARLHPSHSTASLRSPVQIIDELLEQNAQLLQETPPYRIAYIQAKPVIRNNMLSFSIPGEKATTSVTSEERTIHKVYIRRAEESEIKVPENTTNSTLPAEDPVVTFPFQKESEVSHHPALPAKDSVVTFTFQRGSKVEENASNSVSHLPVLPAEDSVITVPLQSDFESEVQQNAPNSISHDPVLPAEDSAVTVPFHCELQQNTPNSVSHHPVLPVDDSVVTFTCLSESEVRQNAPISVIHPQTLPTEAERRESCDGRKRPGGSLQHSIKKKTKKRSEGLGVQQSKYIKVDIDIFLRLKEMKIKRKLDSISDLLFVLLESYDLHHKARDDMQEPVLQFANDNTGEPILDENSSVPEISYDLHHKARDDMQEPVLQFANDNTGEPILDENSSVPEISYEISIPMSNHESNEMCEGEMEKAFEEFANEAVSHTNDDEQNSTDMGMPIVKQEPLEDGRVINDEAVEESVMQPRSCASDSEQLSCDTGVPTAIQEPVEECRATNYEAVEESLIQSRSFTNDSEQLGSLGKPSASQDEMKYAISKDHTYSNFPRARTTSGRPRKKPIAVAFVKEEEKEENPIQKVEDNLGGIEENSDSEEVDEEVEEYLEEEEKEEEFDVLDIEDDERDEDYDPCPSGDSEDNSESDSDDYMHTRSRRSRKPKIQKKTKEQRCKEYQKKKTARALKALNLQSLPCSYSCKVCKEMFPELIDLKQHIVEAHGDQQAPMPKKHKDKVVKEKMMGNMELSEVLGDFEVSALSVILRLCPTCDKYIPEVKIASHMDQHGPLGAVCDLCGAAFKNQTKLGHHTQYCNDKEFKCKACGKKYASKVSRRKHYKNTHLKGYKRPTFQCEICGKEYSNKSCLTTHKAIHMTVKPYECPECGKGFSQKSNMEYHRRVHSGDKPYKCDVCKEAFAHNVSLKTHKKKKHGIDMWKNKGDDDD